MSITLVLNNGASEYTFNQTPGVAIRNNFRHKEDTSDLIENQVVWTVTGLLVPEDGSIKTQVAILEAFLVNAELATVKLMDNSTIIEEVPIERGIRVTSMDFPTGDGPEWATKRTFTIVIEGSEFVVGVTTSGEYNYTITYVTEQSGIVVRTISGTLLDLYGKAASTKYATLKAAQGWVTWTDANLVSDTYTINDKDTKCDFTIVHTKYWTAYQTNITNADVNDEWVTDNQNVQRYTTSGWFEGPAADCLTAISSLKPAGYLLLEESVTRGRHSNRTSFKLSLISVVRNNYLFRRESISIENQIYQSVYKKVLGGGNPIRQVTSRTSVKATQTGSLKRLLTWPVAPNPHWSSDYLQSSRITKVGPEANLAFDTVIYGLNYTYEFEFPYFPGW